MSSPSLTTVRAVRHTAVRFDTATFSTLPFFFLVYDFLYFVSYTFQLLYISTVKRNISSIAVSYRSVLPEVFFGTMTSADFSQFVVTMSAMESLFPPHL